MFHISFLLKTLQEHIIFQSCPFADTARYHRMRILAPAERIQPNTLYITDIYNWKVYQKLHPSVPSASFLFSNSQIPDAVPSDSCCIVTDCLQSVLINHVQALLELHAEALSAIRSAVLSCSTIEEFLNTAAAGISAKLYLMDESQQLLGCSSNANPVRLVRMLLKGHFYSRLQSPQSACILYQSQCTEPAQSLMANRILLPGHGNCELLLEADRQDFLDYSALLPHLAASLQSLLQQTACSTDQAQSNMAFQSILSGHTQGKSHPQMPSIVFPYPVEGFISCIVIPAAHITSHPERMRMLQELQHIFPHCNIGIYQDNIVILHTQAQRPVGSPSWDHIGFKSFLERHDAFAGISSATRSFDMIRTLYLNAAATVQLSISMKITDSAERIFFHKDNSILLMLHLCAAQFKKIYGHQDLIYLTHPAVINLTRYDQQHHSRLVDVMFFYLLNNKNISLTASRLYMHRNTALNKLNKIQQLTGISLDDGKQQFNLLLSCYIVKYCQTVLGTFPSD